LQATFRYFSLGGTRDAFLMGKQKSGRFLNRRIVQLIARLIMGGIFIYASLDKIAFPREFAKIVSSCHILLEKLAIYFSFVLPWIELFLGIFLIAGIFVRESCLALSLPLLAFIVALIIKSLNRTLENCGCFFFKSTSIENRLILIGRDVLFLSCGLFVFFNNQIEIKANKLKKGGRYSDCYGELLF